MLTSKNAEKVAHGLAQQAAADAARTGTAPRCPVVETRAGRVWSCSRPPHGGQHPTVDATRRRQGRSVSADRHYFRAASR